MGGFWAGQTALISAGLATPPRADTTAPPHTGEALEVQRTWGSLPHTGQS